MISLSLSVIGVHHKRTDILVSLLVFLFLRLETVAEETTASI